MFIISAFNTKFIRLRRLKKLAEEEEILEKSRSVDVPWEGHAKEAPAPGERDATVPENQKHSKKHVAAEGAGRDRSLSDRVSPSSSGSATSKPKPPPQISSGALKPAFSKTGKRQKAQARRTGSSEDRSEDDTDSPESSRKGRPRLASSTNRRELTPTTVGQEFAVEEDPGDQHESPQAEQPPKEPRPRVRTVSPRPPKKEAATLSPDVEGPDPIQAAILQDNDFSRSESIVSLNLGNELAAPDEGSRSSPDERSRGSNQNSLSSQTYDEGNSRGRVHFRVAPPPKPAEVSDLDYQQITRSLQPPKVNKMLFKKALKSIVGELHGVPQGERVSTSLFKNTLANLAKLGGAAPRSKRTH